MPLSTVSKDTIKVPDALADFARVRSKAGMGVFASNSPLFKDAVIGRDSIKVARDVLKVYPKVAQEIILTLSKLQGTQNNRRTEEEPGRIHHEYRSLFVDGHKISPGSKAILRVLQQKWGYPSTDSLLYYGCIDATPLFVCLVADYCQEYGKTILHESLVNKDGHVTTVLQSVLAAMQWLSHRIKTSELSLLEYHRSNPRGIENQVWKDSLEAYVHTNGEVANHNQPIAPIEVQGYAYDAFTRAYALLHREFTEQALAWQSLAETLQSQTLRLFWMPDKRYFAQALDRHPRTGATRQIATISSNPALLLGTSIFDNLSQADSRRYVGGIATTIYSHQFLTAVGIRNRSLRFVHVVSYHDYHGAWTVWPKETFDIATGLRRQGFTRLAAQLENRLINGSIITRGYPEFFYCGPNGRVYYGHPQSHPHGGTVIRGTNIPEATQAWTLSALVSIASSRHQPSRHDGESNWRAQLDQKLYLSNSRIEVIKTLNDQHRLYPHFAYWLDTTAAWKFKYTYANRVAAALRQAKRLVGYKLGLAG